MQVDYKTMTPADFATCDIGQLAALRDYADKLKADADFHANLFHAAMSSRFKPNDFGTSNFELGDYTVKATAPKNVSWEQGQLAAIRHQLKEVDMADIVEVKLSVSESSYKALPDAVRKWLEPARTVKAGKVKFEILERE